MPLTCQCISKTGQAKFSCQFISHKERHPFWIIEDKTFYAIYIGANMVISSGKFFEEARYSTSYLFFSYSDL